MHAGRLSQRFPGGPLLKNAAELQDFTVCEEEVLPVRSARVMLADYELLRHDFADLRTQSLLACNPHLARLAHDAQDEAIYAIIDDWLIANCAFVSRPQAQQSVVNTPIETGEPHVIAYRPPRYGRAFVTSVKNSQAAYTGPPRWPVTEDGLLDVKGSGVQPGRVPSHADHSDGLEYLAQALQDYLLKKVIDEIFRNAAPVFWTVPVYAIIDLGFELRDGPRGTGPAAIHVRRAHRRPLFGIELPAYGSSGEAMKFEIEMLLRSYGLTSANLGGSIEVEGEGQEIKVRYNKRPVEHLLGPEELDFFRTLKGDQTSVRFDGVNIQLARETGSPGGQLVDFGQFNLRKTFDRPVVSLVHDRVFAIGGVLWPDSPAFVQPDPALRLPWKRFRPSRLNDYCAELTARWRAGELSRAELSASLEEPIEYLIHRWER